MEIRQLREIHWVFGYCKAGDRDDKGHVMSASDASFKNYFVNVSTCIPIINLIAIGIFANATRGELFTSPVGRLLLLRMAVSLIAAPVLLPIDIIATLILRSKIAHETNKRKLAGVV